MRKDDHKFSRRSSQTGLCVLSVEMPSDALAEHRSRRGTSIFEMVAALGLLSAVMAITLPFFSRLATVRQDVADRELAIHEVRNLVELAQVSDDIQQLKLSDDISSLLEDPQLNISQDTADDLNMQKTNVALTWINQAGQRTQPVELSYWIIKPVKPEAGE